MKTAHEIWSYLNETYGAASDDDKPKEGAHEDDEHIHDMVIVEDCSISWTSDDDDDDQSTTSSLDKVDDGQIDSYTDDIATSSSSPSPHCFMSQGDTKVSNCNVIDLNSYDELLSRYASLIKLFEEVLTKTTKLFEAAPGSEARRALAAPSNERWHRPSAGHDNNVIGAASACTRPNPPPTTGSATVLAGSATGGRIHACGGRIWRPAATAVLIRRPVVRAVAMGSAGLWMGSLGLPTGFFFF